MNLTVKHQRSIVTCSEFAVLMFCGLVFVDANPEANAYIQPEDDLIAEIRDYERHALRDGLDFKFIQTRIDDRFNAWEKKAGEGNPHAQLFYGMCFEWGVGVNRSREDAIKWYRKAADQGLALAQNAIAESLCIEASGLREIAVANEWWRRAAENGNASAQYSVGRGYHTGRGLPKDRVEAVKWYRKAAGQGHQFALWYLGECYERGVGVPQDVVQSMKWYRQAAEQGHKVARAKVESLPPGFVETFRAAEQGDAIAQSNVGFYFAKGMGVDKDVFAAATWFRKAADKGNFGAQFNLALFYNRGTGVRKDVDAAATLWRKAADQGFSRAQLALGSCHEMGRGVPKDFVAAVKWYRMAADQGNSTAQYRLSCCYLRGDGVPQDFNEANRWRRKAADQGYIPARTVSSTNSVSATLRMISIELKTMEEFENRRTRERENGARY